MTRRPRVLFCAHGGERTGPPVLLLRFARWLDEQDVVDQEFILLDGGPLEADFAEIGPTVVLGEFRPPVRLQAIESVLYRLPIAGAAEWARRRYLQRRLKKVARPDLVYINTAGSIRALRYLDRGHAPVITQVHELSVGLTFWLAATDLELLLEVSERLLVVSQAVGDELVDDHGARSDRLAVHHGYVTPAPVDPAASAECRRQLGIPPDARVVGSCGTLDWRKAPDLFVRLAGLVADRAAADDMHFLWLGGGSDSPVAASLERDVARSPVGERIHLVPETADPMPWFGTMDVFALPAREDAFPLVCLEAASLGVPMVCFDNGGMPEFVAARGGGLVAPYPDLDAFAEHLHTLLDDPVRREKMGREARTGIESAHTVDVAAPALWAEIEALVA